MRVQVVSDGCEPVPASLIPMNGIVRVKWLELGRAVLLVLMSHTID